MKKAEISSLNVSIANGDQDAFFTELGQLGSEKLRIKIRSNSYKTQCSAVLEIWSAAAREWHEVVRLYPMEMQTKEGLCYYQSAPVARDFSADRNTLVARAMLVLA